MYAKFFGLHEYPFTSSPDPKYFFPGKTHKEALLHLQYSISQAEGFTLITGEKGIGKTTICRAFAEFPDEKVNTAFISFSKQSPKKLLQDICDKFGIIPEREMLNDLTDAINQFLMQKRTQGKRVVVFLDDAHKYSKDVLEQLRLLSNLETTRDKLLQIVLIGIDELSEMLNLHSLRPLGQRVSVSYQLQPLNEHETFQYIIHRLAIAGTGAAERFEPPAIKQIYHFSKGVPKKINLVCDKALMAAFRQRDKHVSGEIAKATINDLRNRPETRSQAIPTRGKLIGCIFGSIMALCLIGALLFRGETPEIKPEIVKGKIPESLSNNQTIKNQQPEPESESARNHEPQRNKVGPSAPIQNWDTEQTNGRQDDVSSSNTYSIQVGAYRVLKNAQDKIVTIHKKGYVAQIINFQDSDGKILHTVRIGNYDSKEIAKEAADILFEQDGIEGVVLPFDKF